MGNKVIEPRKYQTRTVENFKNWVDSNEKLATIILPTGCGKTITAALSLATCNKKVIWLAHREELVSQAYEALHDIMPDRKISIEMAENKADPDSEIVVGSVQTVARERKHFEGFEPEIIFIDEYHHYSKDNIQYDGLLQRWPNAKIMGASATPFRFSGEDLPLGRTLIQMDIGTAVNKGYLVPPIPETLATNVSLADVKTSMGDFAIKELSNAVNTEARNQLIAKRIIELVRDAKRQGILFAVDVAHSKAMAEILRKEVRVAEIYGDTPKDERRYLMEKIRNQEVDVAVNNMIFTEGTDLPHMSFIGMARPTRSLGLYIQAIGRGLRTHPNKKDCIVIDVHDKVKIKQSRIVFKDMALSGDLYGERKRAINLLKTPPELDVAQRLINFPIFIKPEKTERWMPDEDTFPISAWSIAQDQWIITWTKEIKLQKVKTKKVWAGFIDNTPKLEDFDSMFINADDKPKIDKKALKGTLVQHKSFGDGIIKELVEDGDDPKVSVVFGWDDERLVLLSSLSRQIEVHEDIPEEFDITKISKLFYICLPPSENLGRFMSFERQRSHLKLNSDKRLSSSDIRAFLVEQAQQDGVFPLVRAGVKWKTAPASEAQKNFIKTISSKIGYDLDLDSLNKGEASAILEQAKWQELIIKKFGTEYKNKLLGYDINNEDNL